MNDKKYYEERYKSNDMPWNHETPDFNLVNLFNRKRITAKRILDIGCGVGSNSIWLANRGFKVTGTDFSKTAIKMAKENAKKAKVEVTFIENDFLKEKVKGYPFGFIFDRGCFHALDKAEERETFAENAAMHLEEGGKWFSLIGCKDEKREEDGPPQRSLSDIVTAIEPFFEIQFIASGYFQSKKKVPPKAWICLMQKRKL